MMRATAVSRFAKAALDAGTDAEQSGKGADAVVKVTSLVLEVATVGPLLSLLDRLQLYRCMTQSALCFLGPLWQIAEFAATHKRRPVHL